MIVYRCSLRKWAGDLSGSGSYLHGGRWNSPGTRLIYTAENNVLAAFEIALRVPLDQLSLGNAHPGLGELPCAGIDADNCPDGPAENAEDATCPTGEVQVASLRIEMAESAEQIKKDCPLQRINRELEPVGQRPVIGKA